MPLPAESIDRQVFTRVQPNLISHLRPEATSYGSTGFWVLFIAAGLLCAIGVVQPEWGLGFAGAVLAVGVVVVFLAAIFGGKVDLLVLTWALIFPLGYYYLSFPTEKAIFTLDRMLPVAVGLAILFHSSQSAKLPDDIKRCGVAWGAFLLFAAVSLKDATDRLASGRLLVEGFLLPAIMGWIVIRYLKVRENAVTLHLIVCVMSVYSACIGGAEVILKKDILPLPGSELTYAGPIPRPNGPFATNDAFALIGFTSFCLLLFLRNLLDRRLTPTRSFIHYAGVAAALAMALMPMWRSLDIALILVLLIATATTKLPSERRLGISILVLGTVGVVALSILAPDVYSDRSDPANVYGRFAQQMQTWRVFVAHPVLGVGLGSFHDVVNQDTGYLAAYSNVRSVDWPHNNVGGILAETGLLGVIPYLTAQAMLFAMFWRMRRSSSESPRLAWTYFLYMFIGYWCLGMDESSGYISDLNLWFMFAVAVLYKYSIDQEPSPKSRLVAREAVVR